MQLTVYLRNLGVSVYLVSSDCLQKIRFLNVHVPPSRWTFVYVIAILTVSKGADRQTTLHAASGNINGHSTEFKKVFSPLVFCHHNPYANSRRQLGNVS